MNTKQDVITNFWDTRPESYDGAAFHGLRDAREKAAWLDALRGLLGEPPLDVLDAGTGTGFLALFLAELGHRVTGIDLSEGMLVQAQAKAAGLPAPPLLMLGDAIDPPLPPGSFDVVVCRHLLWTLLDPVGACANWRRLLRPGGRMIAIEWFHPTPGAWDPYPAEVTAALPLRHLSSPAQVEAAVRDAGFADVQVVRLTGIERVERDLAPDEAEHAPERYAVTGEAR
jgi:SAM-dependent methyltransferase